ncbi:MAG: GNAT family N-acetyltransferase [Actinomycetota bacterium]|nr:GNAT family N-acetyltransferase [Actinomycetota bacterium]
MDHAGIAFAAGMLVPFDDEQAEIKRLYVRPTHQCEGVGRVLVQTLLDIARDLGYRAVVLDVMSARPAAVGLYERSGFVAVQAFRTYPAHHGMRFYRRSL